MTPRSPDGENSESNPLLIVTTVKPMLGEDTILRRVPTFLDRKQLLFIDGIRHSVDIMDLAYSRLRALLTGVATADSKSIRLPSVSTQAFLDAWALVDAIDRFRMLYSQFPGMTRVALPEGDLPLNEVTQPFRDLRNVADHLAQRADLVVAKDGAALGTLIWLTAFKIQPMTLWYCTLRPGTIRANPKVTIDRFESTFDFPTDQIRLSAGGYEANLSAIRPHIERRVRHFEGQLEAAIKRVGAENGPVASDVFFKRPFQLAPGQFLESE
jgi:hypothetical protein